MNVDVVKKSNFVTILAWILIVSSVMGILGQIGQFVALNVLMPADFLQTIETMPNAPPMALFFFKYNQLLMGLFLILFVFLLISSIQFLKRKSWARKVIIVYLSIAILGSIAAFIFQNSVINEIATAAATRELDGFILFNRIASGVFSLLFIALFGWFIKKLMSPAIQQEFI
jgi:hypothetical protein